MQTAILSPFIHFMNNSMLLVHQTFSVQEPMCSVILNDLEWRKCTPWLIKATHHQQSERRFPTRFSRTAAGSFGADCPDSFSCGFQETYKTSVRQNTWCVFCAVTNTVPYREDRQLTVHIKKYSNYIICVYIYMYTYIYIYVYTYIYICMVQRSNPPPPRHGHGSAIVLLRSPPVVWWVCGYIYIYIVYIYICKYVCTYIYIYMYMYTKYIYIYIHVNIYDIYLHI